ncbi:hypothetical protein M569_13235 [Genlisea aurea]|uniref:Uncharacterized protein n=1 Tax=Genlisea aurea TaxID=192259 RepID=S8C3W7_9LAMI|nr:hypothetical protein M569_13235 [Genlisea aurea]
MADEKGLDLSLGLPCGGNNNTSSSKAKCSTSSDTRSTEEDRGHKLINEFKNFLEGGNQHSLKAKESSSYQQFSKTDHHHHHHHHSETSKSIDERPVMVGEKRKSLFFMADEGSTAENEDIADSEKDGFGHSDSTEIFVQKRSAVLLENELKSADETTILPSYPLIQGTGGAHFPVMFGYPSAQLPTLDNASFLGRNLVNQSNPGTLCVPFVDLLL